MPLKTHLDDEPVLNLTAMLDIMFLLIIFFMLGTKFVEDEERSLKFKVPKVVDRAGALTAAPAKKIVNVDREGKVTLDQKTLTLPELTAVLAKARKEYPDLPVLVRGDARLDLQHVTEVLNACKQAGVKDMGLTVRVVQTEKK
jgi:biopolymer transport protein ExbD